MPKHRQDSAQLARGGDHEQPGAYAYAWAKRATPLDAKSLRKVSLQQLLPSSFLQLCLVKQAFKAQVLLVHFLMSQRD